MKLKRSYFHFDLPNNSQISNWIQYISLNESLENNEITKNLYERCLIPCYLIPEIWIKYSLFILNIEGEEESLKILNRAFNSPLKIHSKFLYLYGTFLESINQLNLSNEIFEKLINLPINFEIEFYYYLYKLRIGENNINRLEFFLENTNNPIDITIISGLLIKLNKNINLNKLIEKCSSISNSLNIISKILLKENKINELKNIYHLYLIDNKSKLSLKNKLKLLPQYLLFLEKYSFPLNLIKKILNYQLDLEKNIRLELLNERKEESKHITDLNEVLDNWILYLQESESLYNNNIE